MHKFLWSILMLIATTASAIEDSDIHYEPGGGGGDAPCAGLLNDGPLDFQYPILPRYLDANGECQLIGDEITTICDYIIAVTHGLERLEMGLPACFPVGINQEDRDEPDPKPIDLKPVTTHYRPQQKPGRPAYYSVDGRLVGRRETDIRVSGVYFYKAHPGAKPEKRIVIR